MQQEAPFVINKNDSKYLSNLQIKKAKFIFENEYFIWNEAEMYLRYHEVFTNAQNADVLYENACKTTRVIFNLIHDVHFKDTGSNAAYLKFFEVLDAWGALTQYIKQYDRFPTCFLDWIESIFQIYSVTNEYGDEFISYKYLSSLYTTCGINNALATQAYNRITFDKKHLLTVNHLTHLLKYIVISSEEIHSSYALIPKLQEYILNEKVNEKPFDEIIPIHSSQSDSKKVNVYSNLSEWKSPSLTSFIKINETISPTTFKSSDFNESPNASFSNNNSLSKSLNNEQTSMTSGYYGSTTHNKTKTDGLNSSVDNTITKENSNVSINTIASNNAMSKSNSTVLKPVNNIISNMAPRINTNKLNIKGDDFNMTHLSDKETLKEQMEPARKYEPQVQFQPSAAHHQNMGFSFNLNQMKCSKNQMLCSNSDKRNSLNDDNNSSTTCDDILNKLDFENDNSERNQFDDTDRELIQEQDHDHEQEQDQDEIDLEDVKNKIVNLNLMQRQDEIFKHLHIYKIKKAKSSSANDLDKDITNLDASINYENDNNRQTDNFSINEFKREFKQQSSCSNDLNLKSNLHKSINALNLLHDTTSSNIRPQMIGISKSFYSQNDVRQLDAPFTRIMPQMNTMSSKTTKNRGIGETKISNRFRAPTLHHYNRLNKRNMFGSNEFNLSGDSSEYEVNNEARYIFPTSASLTNKRKMQKLASNSSSISSSSKNFNSIFEKHKYISPYYQYQSKISKQNPNSYLTQYNLMPLKIRNHLEVLRNISENEQFNKSINNPKNNNSNSSSSNVRNSSYQQLIASANIGANNSSSSPTNTTVTSASTSSSLSTSSSSSLSSISSVSKLEISLNMRRFEEANRANSSPSVIFNPNVGANISGGYFTKQKKNSSTETNLNSIGANSNSSKLSCKRSSPKSFHNITDSSRMTINNQKKSLKIKISEHDDMQSQRLDDFTDNSVSIGNKHLNKSSKYNLVTFNTSINNNPSMTQIKQQSLLVTNSKRTDSYPMTKHKSCSNMDLCGMGDQIIQQNHPTKSMLNTVTLSSFDTLYDIDSVGQDVDQNEEDNNNNIINNKQSPSGGNNETNFYNNLNEYCSNNPRRHSASDKIDCADTTTTNSSTQFSVSDYKLMLEIVRKLKPYIVNCVKAEVKNYFERNFLRENQQQHARTKYTIDNSDSAGKIGDF